VAGRYPGRISATANCATREEVSQKANNVLYDADHQDPNKALPKGQERVTVKAKRAVARQKAAFRGTKERFQRQADTREKY